MLTLSRAVFGVRGNVLPTLVSWISLLGWECVTVITGTLTVEALLQAIFGLGSSAVLSLLSMVIFGALVIALGLLGHATLIVVQKYSTWIFGILTLIVSIFLLASTNWSSVLHSPSGNWVSGFLPALSIIMAGTGLGWVNQAADYSRYQSRKASSGGIISMTTFGATIPLFLLIMVGVLLTTRVPDLASATNPIAAIGHALPKWMTIPYLVTAAGGIIGSADLNMYSSGLNLLTIGIRLQRYKSVIIDSIVMFLVTIYVLFIQKDFLGPLESFLSLTGVGLSSWVAVFIVDQWLVRGRIGYEPEAFFDASRGGLGFRCGFNTLALLCWGAGVVIGFLFTNSPLFVGPFAKGLLSNISLELTFLVSGILYAIVLYFRRDEITTVTHNVSSIH